MARKIPGKELGIDAPLVRVSTGKRAGKILAVQHPIFGWLPYKQWALLRLIPEERIVPAIIMGVSTFWILKGAMDIAGKVMSLTARVILPVQITIGPFFGIFGPLLRAINPESEIEPEDMASAAEELWSKHPLPFYGALLVAGLTIAGLDAGDVLRALVQLIDIL